MLELAVTATAATAAHLHAGTGPTRRTWAAAEPAPALGAPDILARMLDEIDYGVVLVDAQARVLYLNHPARTRLGDDHALQLAADRLRCAAARDQAALLGALQGAQRGLRRLLMLGDGDRRTSISVVPLGAAAPGEGATLLLLGKRQVCAALSIRSFARSVKLTSAEERVLAALCEGTRPSEIARDHGVELSTVRTQVCSIRAKAGARSVNAVVRQVALLPPLVCVLRGMDLPGNAVQLAA